MALEYTLWHRWVHLNEGCQQRESCSPVKPSVHHLLYLHLICHPASIVHATLPVPACILRFLLWKPQVPV